MPVAADTAAAAAVAAAAAITAVPVAQPVLPPAPTGIVLATYSLGSTISRAINRKGVVQSVIFCTCFYERFQLKLSKFTVCFETPPGPLF
jgi:hypothetical protein